MPRSRRNPTTMPLMVARRASTSIRPRRRTVTPRGIRMQPMAAMKTSREVSLEGMGRRTSWAMRGVTAATEVTPRATEVNPARAADRGDSPRLTDQRCHFTRGRMGRPSGPTAITRWPQGREPPARRKSRSAPSPMPTSERSNKAVVDTRRNLLYMTG